MWEDLVAWSGYFKGLKNDFMLVVVICYHESIVLGSDVACDYT